MLKLFSCLLLSTLFTMSLGSSCTGEHQYKDELGVCKSCEKCAPGFEPSMFHCGFGVKDKEYGCVPCQAGTYSTNNDYRLCITCNPCSRWNSYTSSSCTSTSNSQCSSCFSGFYRPIKSDGDLDNECHLCKEGSEIAECLKSEADWKFITIILIVVFSVIFLIGISFCVRRQYKKQGNRRQNESKNVTDSNASLPNNNIWRVLMCKSSTDTVTSSSLEPLTKNYNDHCQEKPNFSTPLKDCPLEQEVPRFNVTQCDHDLDVGPSTYADKHTAEFNEIGNNPEDYSHLATRQYITNEQTFQPPPHQDNRDCGSFLIEVDHFDTTSSIHQSTTIVNELELKE